MRALAPLLLVGCTATASQERIAALGVAAPDFTLQSLSGDTVKLSDHRGKTVVLEWFNPGCPFVVAAHKEGGALATRASEQPDDVVWLAINSGGSSATRCFWTKQGTWGEPMAP